MARTLAFFAVIAGISLASGCSMCCTPHDPSYLYQGGKWVRDNPCSGRVGSAFDPAGYDTAGTSGRMVPGAEIVVQESPEMLEELPIEQEMAPPRQKMARPARAPSRVMRTSPYLPTE